MVGHVASVASKETGMKDVMVHQGVIHSARISFVPIAGILSEILLVSLGTATHS